MNIVSLTLTELIPSPSFGEHHERVITAPRAAIEQAMDEVTVGEVRLLAPLFAVRSLPMWFSRRGGAEPFRRDRRLTEAFSGGGFEWFAREPGLQLFVQVGQPHHLRPGESHWTGSPEAFAGFDAPGFCRIAADVRLIEREGRLLVSTDTLVDCTDAATRRSFRRYWLLIRPFSGAIRRSWLAAIDRRARAATPARRPRS